MIILYDINGKIIGRYDTPSDVWDDYPDAEINGRKAKINRKEVD